jgi:hypothetical protein
LLAEIACLGSRVFPGPDGHYFGLAVISTGITYAIWSEADGSTIYCCGDTWYTHGPTPDPARHFHRHAPARPAKPTL